MKTIEVLFTPAEFALLPHRDLSDTVCVVFDVLRATSTFVTALANGAAAVIPVGDISGALAWRQKQPEVLLAGEREGVRIRAHQTGGVDFELGNSPREFTAEKVRGRTIVSTTTNGTRALQACAAAQRVLIGSFLNLAATADCVKKYSTANLLLVCSGTGERAAFEDFLAAGALCELIFVGRDASGLFDSASLAREVFLRHQPDLMGAMRFSANGRHLLTKPDLRGDVAFCLQQNVFGLVVELGCEGALRA